MMLENTVWNNVFLCDNDQSRLEQLKLSVAI